MASATGFDAFELLGLPAAYDLDPAALQQAYLKQARVMHPDRLAARPPAEQAEGARRSAQLNRAHELLRDPVLRAEHLLERAGGPDAAGERTVPQRVLTETLMLREEVDEARRADDHAALSRLRETADRRLAEVQAGIAAAARALSADPETHRALRLELNSIRYYQRILEQFES